MKKWSTIFLFVLLAISAQAQRQSTVVQLLNNSSAVGRVVPSANDLIGAGASYWTYCTTATSLAVIAEESPDNNSLHYVAISPTYGIPSSINGNSCGLIQAGGLFGYPAFNVLAISGGVISVWYSASTGVVSSFPPAFNSSGATAPAQCDQTAFANTASGTAVSLISGTNGEQIHVCGFTLSFVGSSGNTGFASLTFGVSSTCTGGGSGTSFEIYLNTQSTPLDINRSFVLPPGDTLCFSPPASGTSGNVISISYAKF
jgi:hypothetical protein